jgi:UDP-glucose 4-epimerase
MHTILITGGLGYIGSHIAIQLLNYNNISFNVIIIDNLSNSNINKLDIIKKSITNTKKLEFIEMDLLNNELNFSVTKLLRK